MATAAPTDSAHNGLTPPLESPLQHGFPNTAGVTTEDETPSTGEPTATAPENKWPGWPGDCIFRLIVPVVKIGSIIGRKGELIKKMCGETRARVRVLDGAVGTPDRIVLISGKEELGAPLSPAMDAVLRIFKRVTGLSESEGDGKTPGAAGVTFCSVRLLVASTQAISLIGKQGSLIRSIRESNSASVRVLSGDEVPFYVASDERIVELQGEALNVQKALESVLGHLRKFLVDHTVLPLFEKNHNTTVSQDHQVESWPDKSLMHTNSQSGSRSDYSFPGRRESLFLDRETHLESQISPSGAPIYAQDPAISALRSSGLSRSNGPIVTQVVQTMQIPLTYAEDIIGIEGVNIGYIRRNSGAILTVQESRGLPDEIIVEVRGASLQVQTAQQLIQEFISNRSQSVTSSYREIDTGLRSSYYPSANTLNSMSSLSGQPYRAYGSSGVGGYSSFRL